MGLKKLLVGIACFLVAGLGAVIAYLAIPKDTPIELTVEVEDVELVIGENAELEWSVNINDALITVEIENKNIASYNKTDNKYVITGLAIGETNIKINAKYNGAKASDTAKITVIEKVSAEPPNEPNETPETPPQEDPENPPVAEPTNIFKETMFCTIESNKIILNNNAIFALVQISLGDEGVESLSFEYDTSNINVVIDENIGNNTYNIFVNVPGEYDLKIIINNIEYNYIVVKNQ